MKKIKVIKINGRIGMWGCSNRNFENFANSMKINFLNCLLLFLMLKDLSTNLWAAKANQMGHVPNVLNLAPLV